MKKRVLTALLASAMLLSVAGCGGSGNANNTAAPAPAAGGDTTAAAPAAGGDDTPAAPAAAAEGKVLNIYCWNEEFKSRLEDHYPGYTKIDATSGTIGDVTVNFNITPTTDNAYQMKLDDTLPKNAGAAADDKVDLFLIEADYALKYIGSEYAMPLADLGITDADLANQFQYTKDVVTDNGVIKGISWQGCPGALFYNRAAAKEVFGSDDENTVQEKVKDWATFASTAAEMSAAGYKMNATVNDSYRVFSNNVSTKWVEGGKINVDANIKNWVDLAKEWADKGYMSTEGLWSDDWSNGFYPEGKVFCYFGPAWLINFCMAADVDGSIGNQGGWGICDGPQSFNWGGTWICGAAGTDNPTLVADIMRKLCCDEAIMKEIVEKDDDFVNNKPAMEAMAADTSYSSAVLGGINPLPKYLANAASCDLSKMTIYDQACTEEFQSAMKNYFDGNATYEEALDKFYKGVQEKHPELEY